MKTNKPDFYRRASMHFGMRRAHILRTAYFARTWRVLYDTEVIFEFLHASRAYVLAFVSDDVFGIATEDTCRFIFFQYDRRAIDIYFKCVLFRRCREFFSILSEGQPSTKLVDFSYYSCRLHTLSSLTNIIRHSFIKIY